LSGTTWARWYQKGKTSLDFTEAGDNGWQWHQLGHMQIICTSLQTDNLSNGSTIMTSDGVKVIHMCVCVCWLAVADKDYMLIVIQNPSE